MASTRRMGTANSEVRASLIEAAEHLIQTEGVSAVTARRLAEKVGLKRQIVHYYFGTIDELIVALLRRNGDRVRELILQRLDSDEPLRAIWEAANHPVGPIFEFLIMASQSEAIRAEVNRYTEEFRKLQVQGLERHLEQRGIKPNIPACVAAVVVSSISRTIALERSMGVTECHAQTAAYVDEWLQAFAARGESPAIARS